MGDKSRFNGLVEHYVTQGMTEEQAKQKATLDKIAEVALAGIGDVISGSILDGLTNGMNYVTAQSLGQAVKTEGLTPTVLQQALGLPADTQAHRMAESLSEQVETALIQAGLDISGLYHMSLAQQKSLIDQVSEQVLSDQTVGKLAKLVNQETP